jgi:Type II secretion system (T2SS), protein M subtype b
MRKNSQTGRLPFLALPLIFLMGFCGILGFFLFQIWSSGQDEIAQQLSVFDKLRSIAAYKGQLDRATTPLDSSQLFYDNGTPAIVSAQLLANFKQMAGKHGLEILRSGDLPAVIEGPLTLFGGSFDLSGPASNIYVLVQEIELTKPLLFIDQLDLHANGGSDLESAADTPLTVTMQIYGAVHGTGAVPPAVK